MLIYLPELICVIGLVVYALATNPKASECGRLMFWTGLLATLLNGIHHP